MIDNVQVIAIPGTLMIDNVRVIAMPFFLCRLSPSDPRTVYCTALTFSQKKTSIIKQLQLIIILYYIDSNIVCGEASLLLHLNSKMKQL